MDGPYCAECQSTWSTNSTSSDHRDVIMNDNGGKCFGIVYRRRKPTTKAQHYSRVIPSHACSSSHCRNQTSIMPKSQPTLVNSASNAPLHLHHDVGIDKDGKYFGIAYHRRKWKAKAQHYRAIPSHEWSLSDHCKQERTSRVMRKKAKVVLVKSNHSRSKYPDAEFLVRKKVEQTLDFDEHGVLVRHGNVVYRTHEIRSRAKVDLDERTVKKWEALGKSINSESVGDCEDEVEGEWWRNERESLYKNVESFISSMQLIQGERKFSQWKGSVLDSIGAAYLAQNVSDTLSSSAFISLAAKYSHVGTVDDDVNSALKTSICSSTGRSTGRTTSRSSRGKGTKKELHDWNSLKQRYSKGDAAKKTSEDALDWNAVRTAKVKDVSKAIKQRGMNNNLAARIKNCLGILEKGLGSLDLEWLRDVPPSKVKECLASLPGLGIKSADCICLLTLHQKAFPVDTNAGRVAVRLGWVPLQPLSGGQEFHLLKEYPKVNSVQMYLWPRLCQLDHSILYELHCQIITAAKVFCTKINPNCGACPMNTQCKYHASALASGRSPAGKSSETLTIITPQTARDGPVLKSKNLTHLRTEHQVFVLPDSHPVLTGVQARDPEDLYPYLLATWTLGNLDDDKNIPEDDTVYATLLIPIRTAMRGVFPLNGTFFQANEIFADDESSKAPIKVSRALVQELPHLTLYCGNNMAAICKGMNSHQVRKCFKQGYVCFRGFNRKIRESKPLSSRFHYSKKKTMDSEWNEPVVSPLRFVQP